MKETQSPTIGDETNPAPDSVVEELSYEGLCERLEEKCKKKEELEDCIEIYNRTKKDIEQAWVEKVKEYKGRCFRDGNIEHYVTYKDQRSVGKLNTIAINQSWHADRIEKDWLLLNKDWSLLSRYTPISQEEFKAHLTDKFVEFWNCLEGGDDE